jgi:hypothetical protein
MDIYLAFRSTVHNIHRPASLFDLFRKLRRRRWRRERERSQSITAHPSIAQKGDIVRALLGHQPKKKKEVPFIDWQVDIVVLSVGR